MNIQSAGNVTLSKTPINITPFRDVHTVGVTPFRDVHTIGVTPFRDAHAMGVTPFRDVHTVLTVEVLGD